MSEQTPSAISLLRPLPSRVVLRRLEPAAAPSPFIVPDSAKEKPVEAEVVAIPSVPTYEYGILIPCPVSEGDLVLVGKYAGDHRFRGEDVTIIRWDEILAVIQTRCQHCGTPFSPRLGVGGMEIPQCRCADPLGVGKPSAADLDHVADEKRAEELTERFLGKVESDRVVPRL